MRQEIALSEAHSAEEEVDAAISVSKPKPNCSGQIGRPTWAYPYISPLETVDRSLYEYRESPCVIETSQDVYKNRWLSK